MKHTKEPWDYVYENGAWEGYHEPGSGEFKIAFKAKTEANAARIVACVNACAEFDDPEQWVAIAKTHIEASEAQANQNQRLKAEIEQLKAHLNQ